MDDDGRTATDRSGHRGSDPDGDRWCDARTEPEPLELRTERDDRSLSTESTESDEPTLPTERNEPIDPIEHALPTEKIERNEDSEPMLRNEFLDHSDQRELSEGVAVAGRTRRTQVILRSVTVDAMP
jgi:hypothetical protein